MNGFCWAAGPRYPSRRLAHACCLILLALCAALQPGAIAQAGLPTPSDPIVRDLAQFDAKRPVAQELQTNVPDGFTVAAVGDLIISRPVSQYAQTLPGFGAVLTRFRQASVVYGNLETTIFDVRHFSGAPYSWDGDWTNAALPSVARDLGTMGFGVVARANNHALDWGIDGMRETSRWLEEAGIVHAGVGETRGLARAPQYLETPHGRVALVSLASTFRPTTDALPPQGATPGRPGVNALHLTTVAELPPAAMKTLAALNCELYQRTCSELPDRIDIFAGTYRLGDRFSYEHTMDPEDLAEIYRAIRAARQNADFVIVSIHTHECSVGCDDDAVALAPGHFLRELAHGAIDAGADVFVANGNHNLGPAEIYAAPGRGPRPIFYGLGNFIWSDVQELLPHDLFQANRELLAKAWVQPENATEYDLSAPLNAGPFSHAFTFQSVVAECRFTGNQLERIELRPVELGYGSRLTASGIPRLVTDAKEGAAIIGQIVDQTARYGLPQLKITYSNGVAVIRP